MRTRSILLAAALCIVAPAALFPQTVSQVVNAIVATTCTNQLVRSIAASGAGTCATVALATDTSGTLAATNGGTGVSNSFNTTVTSATSIGRGQYQGTGTNDAATAGNIGEYLSNTAALGSVSLTTNTAANAGTLSLTAGDWDVQCLVYFLPAASTTVDGLHASLSTTSATISSTIGFFSSLNYPSIVMGNNYYTVETTPLVRASITSTTSYYCIAFASFGISTMTAGGFVRARRVR